MALRQETVSALATPLHHAETFCGDSAPPLASEDFDDVDEFQDAPEEPLEYDMDLQTAFEECEVAMRKFFNNDLEGASNIMKPWCRSSLYHSLGTSIFEFIPAMLTFDQPQIARALAALKVCIGICNQHRRNFSLVESIGTIIRKPNFSSYTDLEAHAELCYAEALLLQAMMTIMEGEDLTGLIKGTLKVKSCYNSYKDCAKILARKQWESEASRVHFHSGVRLGTATFNVMISLLPPRVVSLLEFVGFSGDKVSTAKILARKQWESEASRVHFHSGVRLGTATFNVMISLLPPRVVSLLEFVGFSGDKKYGLSELVAGMRSAGLRSVLCELTLLAYHLVICHFIGVRGDLDICQEILDKELKVYPDGVWFLLFKGRLELMRGMFDSSIVTYNLAIDSQDMWPQFRHVCYWEIMWVNGLKMEWRQAALYASKLMEESSWSRTIYSYTRAALLLQLPGLAPAERQHCSDLMRNASYYKQRIAGKSLPMEKFMIKRCGRYAAQGGRLVLPALELLCLWNMFHVLARDERAAQDVLKLIESTRAELDSGPRAWMAGYDGDNRALVRYLHGCCLAAMGLPRLALDSLDAVMQLKNEIKEDTFLLPYAMAEIGMCYHYLGDGERAAQILQDTRKKYSGYSLESRLHFRMHSRMIMIKEADQKTKT